MKKLAFFTSVWLFLMVFAATIQAKEYDYRLEFFGSIGWGRYWGDESFRGNGVNYGAGMAYFLRSGLGVELEIDGGKHARSFETGVRFEGSTLYAAGSVVYRISKKRGQPYALIGLGLLSKKEKSIYSPGPPAPPVFEQYTSKSTGLGFHVGVGIKIFLSTDLSLRPEFRFVADGPTEVKWYYRLSLGLGYHK